MAKKNTLPLLAECCVVWRLVRCEPNESVGVAEGVLHNGLAKRVQFVCQGWTETSPCVIFLCRQFVDLPGDVFRDAKVYSARFGPFSVIGCVLKALGLVSVTAADVRVAVKTFFPQGTADMDEGDVIKAVFLHLKGRP